VDRRDGTKSDGREQQGRRGLRKCGDHVADATIAAAAAIIVGLIPVLIPVLIPAIIVGLMPVAALVTRIDRRGPMGDRLRIREDMDGLLRLRPMLSQALRLLPPSNGRIFFPTPPCLLK